MAAKGPGIVKKILGAPGAVAGFVGGTVANTVGTVVESTVGGVVTGFKGSVNLKKKILGEAAEAATKGADDVAQGASKTSKVTYSRDGDNFYRQVEGGKKHQVDSKTYGQANRQRIAQDRMSTPSHKNYTASNYSSTFTMEEDIATEMAESGAGFLSGIGQWVEDNAVLAAGIAGGVGVAGGALLFGDDDD